jgi:hypothetical protein
MPWWSWLALAVLYGVVIWCFVDFQRIVRWWERKR